MDAARACCGRRPSPGGCEAVDTPEPQAILTPLTAAAIFLVVTVDRGAEAPVRELLADVSALTRSVGFRIPEAGLTCVTGIGSELWDRMLGEPRPAQLHPLPEFAGSVHSRAVDARRPAVPHPRRADRPLL